MCLLCSVSRFKIFSVKLTGEEKLLLPKLLLLLNPYDPPPNFP
jgi:hypothetical protein